MQKIGDGNFKVEPSCRKENAKERIPNGVCTHHLVDILDGEVDVVVRPTLACSPYLIEMVRGLFTVKI